MSRQLHAISWYVDRDADAKGEPGIRHSYMSCLATALNYAAGDVDPVWLMGASGFAFRISVSQILCPSAMSVFDWNAVLPEAVEQAGRHCIYVSRLWHEAGLEEERRREAHAAIVGAIASRVPAIAWDVADCEWGLITGYDDSERLYSTLTCTGEPATLPYEKLGRNGIDILSVAILGGPNERAREDIVTNSLRAAVAHADQKEWADRPDYQDGLPAFDLWSQAYDKWALIVGAGRAGRIGVDIASFAAYNASHIYSFRCYARDYLYSVADRHDSLREAADCYARVASHLKPVWELGCRQEQPDAEALAQTAETIRSAKAAEVRGLSHIREYLSAVSV